MREVQNKWNTLKLNDDIWAKLIYFEQNRRLAKAYVSTPVLTIDGSTNGLDGFRIGLSGIENSYRNLDSIACLRSIGQGIKLKIDHQGNILIRKLAPTLQATSTLAAGPASNGTVMQQQHQTSSSCSVWVKEWPPKSWSKTTTKIHDDTDGGTINHRAKPVLNSGLSSGGSDYSQLSSSSSSSSTTSSSSPSGHSSGSLGASTGSRTTSAQDWPMQEIVDPEQSYKLFDMQKFRLQLERNRRAARNSLDGTSTTPIDWRQCVSIISFNRARLDRSAARLSQRHGPASSKQQQQQQQQVLDDPCWLMLINIIAIDMLKSSVCDSRPSPGAQTSALVNKYQNENVNPRASRANVAAKNDFSKQAPAQPLQEQQVESDYGRIGTNYQMKQHQRGKQAIPSQVNPLTLPLQNATNYVHGSERLKRLNEFRYNHPGQQQSSLSTKQLQQQQQHRTAGSKAQQVGQRSFKWTSQQQQQQQQQLEGSIYTTFTGKYLDKQHRLRADRRSSAVASYQYSVDDFSPEVMKRSSLNQASSHLLYPMESLRTNGNRGRIAGTNRRTTTAIVSPFGGAPPNRRLSTQVGMGNHLTHSLSAFDLSHGLKLNLRSINSSSIKMNFDSDEDGLNDGYKGQPVDGQHSAEDCVAECEPTSSREDLVAKLSLDRGHRQAGARPELDANQSHQTRRTLKALDNEASEWANLAKKYSLNNGTSNGSTELSSKVKSIESIDDHLSVDCNEDDEEEEDNKLENSTSQNNQEKTRQNNRTDEMQQQQGNKLQQNVSRSSIASSSSSGCADNDYFISQSSNLSMSSSTRSNEGEELSSQPASSSGIICSGNTSDEYERRQSKLEEGAEAVDQVGSPKTNNGPHQQQQKQQQQDKVKSKRTNDQPGVRQRQQQGANARQAISLRRGHNAKIMEFPLAGRLQAHDDEAPCHHCEHPRGLQQQRQQRLQHQCDCCGPSCDQMLGLEDHHLSNSVACDCFCDCLYEPESAGQLLPASCQDELCNCGAFDPDGASEQQTRADPEEEPIYDHLPRFGRGLSSSAANTKDKQQRSATRAASEDKHNPDKIHEEGYDRIGTVADSLNDKSQTLDKSKKQYASSNELKRNKGWLESRKYIKLFPRFMFSSTSSSSSSAASSGSRNDKHTDLSKSGTLDRIDQMANRFRRTRSSQNLSK